MAQAFEKMPKGTKEFPIGLFSQRTYISEPHHHIEYELFYLTEGQVYFGIGKNVLTVNAGDIVLIEPGENHYVARVNSEDSFHYYALVFDSCVLGNQSDTCRVIVEQMKFNRFLTLPPEILKKFEYITKLEEKKEFGREIHKKSLLLDIFSHLIISNQYLPATIRKTSESQKLTSSFTDIIRYIKEHYREDISLQDILKMTEYSKSHFTKLFREYTGLNFVDYLNNFRVEKSCLDLIYTDKSITDVASENGFNTTSYYSKMFKQYMSCSPKEFQKRHVSVLVPSTKAGVFAE